MLDYVAPLVGARIEIGGSLFEPTEDESLPSWERGLKFALWMVCRPTGRSLPSWERGLKSRSSVVVLPCA